MQRATRAARAAAVALLTALLALVGTLTPAHADDFDFPDGYPRSGPSSADTAGYLLQLPQGRIRAVLFTIQTGPSSEPLLAYCIESTVDYLRDHPLKVVGWDQFPGNNAFASDADVRAKVA